MQEPTALLAAAAAAAVAAAAVAAAAATETEQKGSALGLKLFALGRHFACICSTRRLAAYLCTALWSLCNFKL